MEYIQGWQKKLSSLKSAETHYFKCTAQKDKNITNRSMSQCSLGVDMLT